MHGCSCIRRDGAAAVRSRRAHGGLRFAAALAVALGAAPIPAGAETAEQKEICAEAETIYQKAFGKPSKDEPFTAVLMYKFTFCPIQLSVKRGTTVRWINMDRRTSHSVWLKEAGREESERVFRDEHVEMKIDLPPGDYPYLCGPHWETDKMVGRLTVTGD